MAWYKFRQNNSGGSFQYKPERGISVEVIIEANDYREVLDRAELIGLYFNGCDSGMDCNCCGDRWYESDDIVDEVPEPDEPLIKDESKRYSFTKWIKDGYETFVHPSESDFYGAHATIEVVNAHVYGKINGYGVRGNTTWVSEPFAVNERGWNKEGMEFVPGPNATDRYGYNEDDIIKHGKLRIESNDTYYAIWFPRRKEALEFSQRVQEYQEANQFDFKQFLP